jgi:hypothetical protein
MHIVTLMPHHHHKGSGIPCLDYSHIAHSDDTLCDDHCDEQHEHDDTLPASCGTHKIVVTGPERPELEIVAYGYELPDDILPFGGIYEIMRRISCDETVRLFAEYRSGPDIVVPLMEYIALARPSRAPDLVA